jgi:uncharacterized protein
MSTPEAALKNFSAVVITGGSSGIGKSFIELCGELRPDLAFCNLSRREPAIRNKQLNLRHIACDLSDPEQVRRALTQIEDFLTGRAPTGKILLVNNSGFGAYGRFPEPSVAHQLEMLDVNIRAVIQLTGSLLPAIKARGGAVVTIASTAAFQPTPFLSAYGASKAFVLHWSLALNEELRGTGARALAVCPGPTSTDFFLRAGLSEAAVPNFLGQTSEEVVMATLRALKSGKAMVVSGWLNKIGAAGASKLPKPFAARMAAFGIKRWGKGRAKP